MGSIVKFICWRKNKVAQTKAGRICSFPTDKGTFNENPSLAL